MKLPVAINSTHRFFTSRLSNFPSSFKTDQSFEAPKSSLLFSSLKSNYLLNLCRTTMAVTNSTLTYQSAVVVKDRIDLNHKEKQIFGLLLQVVHPFDPPTELRVAGGWVRDKVTLPCLCIFLHIYILKK